MTVRVVLGIDPGTAHVGVCAVAFYANARPLWAYDEELAPEALTLRWLEDIADKFGVNRVAIELPVPRAMGALRQLIGTAEIAGYVRGLADSLDLDPMQLTSYEWRKRLTGTSNAKDAVIKYALESHMTLPARTNSHKRDAAGVALVAGWEMFDGRLAA